MRVALAGAVRTRTARRRPAAATGAVEAGRAPVASAAVDGLRRAAARDAVVAGAAVVGRFAQTVKLTVHAGRARLRVAGAGRAVVAAVALAAVCRAVRPVSAAAAVPASRAVGRRFRVALS